MEDNNFILYNEKSNTFIGDSTLNPLNIYEKNTTKNLTEAKKFTYKKGRLTSSIFIDFEINILDENSEKGFRKLTQDEKNILKDKYLPSHVDKTIDKTKMYLNYVEKKAKNFTPKEKDLFKKEFDIFVKNIEEILK